MPQALPVEAEPYEFTFTPAQTALLVIDMQRDFVDPGGFGELLGNDVAPLRRAVARPSAACWTRSGARAWPSSTLARAIDPT